MAFVKGRKKYTGDNLNDKVYTPESLAKQIISLYPLSGKVLDPFKGKGAFYNQLPEHTENLWCEIDEGIDFFDYQDKVDWIISNPPYSIYGDVMKKSMEIADNIIYLVPLSKVVSSMGRLREIHEYGGIVSIYYLSSGRANFGFGFPSCAIHIQRGYKGKTLIQELEEQNEISTK
jgi:hypothetical protein